MLFLVYLNFILVKLSAKVLSMELELKLHLIKYFKDNILTEIEFKDI